MIGSVRNLVYATVAYADVFNFPLTSAELALWMIGTPSEKSRNVRYVHVVRRGGQTFYTLKNRDSIVQARVTREQIAAKKWKQAHRAAGWFRYIPTVELVGVTGGLAMNNAKSTDDIDLFFITSGATIWITRAMVTLIAQIAGVRRTPRAVWVKDAMCLNMFMSAWSLKLPTHEQDLFAAHEVLQMKPIWFRNNAYAKFLAANAWTAHFLPQAWNERVNARWVEQTNSDSIWFIVYTMVFTGIAMLVEFFAKVVQLFYMKSHRTHEVIESGVLRFHPSDARVWVKKKFADRLKKRNIPLDTIFYHG